MSRLRRGGVDGDGDEGKTEYRGCVGGGGGGSVTGGGCQGWGESTGGVDGVDEGESENKDNVLNSLTNVVCRGSVSA